MNVPDPCSFRSVRTADGSFTLRSDALGEQYGSLHGAAQESRHVFIHAGMRHTTADPLHVLEVGLGTGLNALLTWIEAERTGRTMRYRALEPFPVAPEGLRALDHPAMIGVPERAEGYWRMMEAKDGQRISLSDRFVFDRSAQRAQELHADAAYDLIYFDAFAPAVQPELWTAAVFMRMFNALRPGAALVTYCAKGEVRRTLGACGFRIERLPGPPGKKEMLRAIRPAV